MTTFYLIRHGEIDANVEKRWHGATDSELNATGLDQASRMGEVVSRIFPEISMIYMSPLKRTIKTANALSDVATVPTVVHQGLREFAIGELEGVLFSELMERHKFFDAIAENQDYAPPGGESINQVRDRMLLAFNDIAQTHKGEHIAVVSHGAAMAIALADLFTGSPYPFFNYQMSNTGVSRLKWGESPELMSFDDTDHL